MKFFKSRSKGEDQELNKLKQKAREVRNFLYLSTFL
jgi:hypothetical protein